eukprot:3698439-Amphidinium_carterae.1
MRQKRADVTLTAPDAETSGQTLSAVVKEIDIARPPMPSEPPPPPPPTQPAKAMLQPYDILETTPPPLPPESLATAVAASLPIAFTSSGLLAGRIDTPESSVTRQQVPST